MHLQVSFDTTAVDLCTMLLIFSSASINRPTVNSRNSKNNPTNCGKSRIVLKRRHVTTTHPPCKYILLCLLVNIQVSFNTSLQIYRSPLTHLLNRLASFRLLLCVLQRGRRERQRESESKNQIQRDGERAQAQERRQEYVCGCTLLGDRRALKIEPNADFRARRQYRRRHRTCS